MGITPSDTLAGAFQQEQMKTYQRPSRSQLTGQFSFSNPRSKCSVAPPKERPSMLSRKLKPIPILSDRPTSPLTKLRFRFPPSTSPKPVPDLHLPLTPAVILEDRNGGPRGKSEAQDEAKDDEDFLSMPQKRSSSTKRRASLTTLPPRKKKAPAQPKGPPEVILLSDSDEEVEDSLLQINSAPSSELQPAYKEKIIIHPLALCTEGKVFRAESGPQTVYLLASILKYTLQGVEQSINYSDADWIVSASPREERSLY